MAPPRSFRPRSASPPSERLAADNLRFIRDTMERAGSFTAVSGIGQIVVGGLGLVAAAIATRQPTRERWLVTWLATAAVSLTLCTWAVSRKARRLGLPLSSRPARRFALGFFPPLVAGAGLTLVFYRARRFDLMPGMWLMLFGTGVTTGGALSIRIVPLMGVCFMAAGGLAFAAPTAWADGFLAAGFGLLLIVFGIIIAVRHGG